MLSRFGSTFASKVGAVRVRSAPKDLCGERSAMAVPPATQVSGIRDDALRAGAGKPTGRRTALAASGSTHIVRANRADAIRTAAEQFVRVLCPTVPSKVASPVRGPSRIDIIVYTIGSDGGEHT